MRHKFIFPMEITKLPIVEMREYLGQSITVILLLLTVIKFAR